MKTSTDNEVKERSIDELIDLPYSEMTDDEIERIIQYKADIQTRDALHNETMKEIHDTLQTCIERNNEVAENAQNALDALTAQAMKRYEDA